MSTNSPTRRVMYHVGDFRKIVLGLLVLAARPVEQFRPEVGLELEDLAADRWQGRFQLARRSQKAAGLDRRQRCRVLLGRSQATSVVDLLAYAFGTIC